MKYRWLLCYCFITYSTAAVDIQKGSGIDPKDSMITYNKTNDYILVEENDSRKIHKIDIGNTTSVILLKIGAEYGQGTPKEEITLQIEETNGITKWEVQKEEPFQNITYISETSTVTITFSYEEYWFNIIFEYEELPFAINTFTKLEDSSSLNDDQLGSEYEQPNRATIVKLRPHEGRWNESSVMLTLSSLEMDETAGNYMLIGAGADPFEGPPAMFLTETLSKPEKYYIMDDTAYIVIYFTSGTKPKFRMSWQRNGNRISEPDDATDNSISDAVLQAVSICFYNASWIEKFNRSIDESDELEEFREKFADIANNYIKEKKLKLLPKVGRGNILLLYVSSITLPNEESEHGTISMMITTVQSYDTRKPVFQWHQMEELVSRYGIHDEKKGLPFGFKVGKCVSNMNYKWWHVVNVLLLLSCGIFFLAIWLLVYRTSWKRRKARSFGKLHGQDSTEQKSIENNYSAFYDNPSLVLTDEEENVRPIRTNTLEDNDNWTLKKRQNVHKPLATDMDSGQGFHLPHQEDRLQGLWRKYANIPMQTIPQAMADVYIDSDTEEHFPDMEIPTDPTIIETNV